MKSDELFDLTQKQQHLTEWLRRYGSAKDIAPEVQANLEITNWQVDALTNRPTMAGRIPANLRYILEQDYGFTKNALPLMPDYDPMLVASSTAVNTSGTTAVYDYIAGLADTGRPEEIDFSNKYTKSYQEIQTQHQRPDQIRELMLVFCGEGTLRRFDKAKQSYVGTKSGTTDRTAAATAIRNTLNGLEGDLFEIARTFRRENMTWKIMSERLAKGKYHGEEYDRLIRQESVRSKLNSGLSGILKERDYGSSTNLNNLWTQTLDCIYAVLGLLKPPSK